MTTAPNTRTGAREIQVGIGQMQIADADDTVLVAHGLGSCIGLAAYDPIARVGAMLHIMLPERKNGDQRDDNPYKYADSGVEAMLTALRERGAFPNRLVLKASGGARVVVAAGFGDRFRIGERNIEATHAILRRLKLKLAAEDVGGNVGRTMRLHMSNGSVMVQSIGRAPAPL